MRLPLFVDTEGNFDRNDFSVKINIGWDDHGLWLACEVRDDSLVLFNEKILQNDALEVFVSEAAGTNQMIQYLIPAGIIAGNSNLNVDKNDSNSGGHVTDTKDIEVTTVKNEYGYILEAHIPFTAVAINDGPEPALQLIFHDIDNNVLSGGKRFSWHYCCE